VLDEHPPRIDLRDGALVTSFDPDVMRRVIRDELYAGDMRPASRWVPFGYQHLPSAVRLAAAKLVFLPRRLRRERQDPPWPNAPALDVLDALVGRRPSTPWGERAWGLSVTVDVDTARGLRAAPGIADVVERAGLRACFFVVGAALAREEPIARELRERGHEIGSHDMVHDNRLFVLPPVEMESRLARARDSVRPFGGRGFRAPSLLRSTRLIEAVGRHFDYDSTRCDTDAEYLRGCATVFPHRTEGCLELPVTLPMDSSLTYLGHSPWAVLEAWKRKCGYIRRLGGLAMLVTHAEPHLTGGARLREMLRAFLEWVREQTDCRCALPGDWAESLLVAGADDAPGAKR